MDAIFRVDGNNVVTSPYAAGPWDPSMQHGSPPAALVVWAAERIPTPVADAGCPRDGRPDAPGAGGAADDRERRGARGTQDPALRGQAACEGCGGRQRDRAEDQGAGRRTAAGSGDRAGQLPGPDQSRVEHVDFSSSPFVTGMSLRAARGHFGVPGPGAIWYRVDRPIVEGAPVSQAMRTMAAADFCNGTSSVLDFREWTFLNADLTVNFSREPSGDWILLDAETWIGPDGAGLAMARLADYQRLFRPRHAEPGHRKALTGSPSIPGRPAGNGRSRRAPCPRSCARRCVRSGRN